MSCAVTQHLGSGICVLDDDPVEQGLLDRKYALDREISYEKVSVGRVIDSAKRLVDPCS